MARTRRQIWRARLALGLAVATLALGAGWLIIALPAGTWGRWVESLDPVALLVAIALLPIFGFPISVLHIAAGARFGLGPGLLVVALSCLIHLLATYTLARTLEAPSRRLLALFGWRLPGIPNRSAWAFSFWVALLPGISYALKNAVPPLMDVPLRVYLGTALPVHVAKAIVGLGIGRATMQFSWPLLAAIATYAVLVVLLTHRLARDMRSRALRPDPDRTRPADDPR